MENFFVRGRKELIFPSTDFLYHNAAILNSRTLKFDGCAIQLPFVPVYMRNLKFDVFLVSDSQELYRVNKHKKQPECIGTVTDRILAIECGYDRIFILTDVDVMILNAYFNLEKTVLLSTLSDSSLLTNMNEKCKIRVGDDVIALIFPDLILMLNFDLNVTGSVDGSASDAVFIQRYNKFAISYSEIKAIKFIEPNGLEHGDRLPFFGDTLCILDVHGSEVLLISDHSRVTGYFMKNFFWYRKFHLQGTFYGVESNTVLIRDGNALNQFFIFRELSNGLVVDGNQMYYTDFSKAIIPPPFYFKKIDTGSQILDFIHREDKLYVLGSETVSVFSVALDGTVELVEQFQLNLHMAYVSAVFIKDSMVFYSDGFYCLKPDGTVSKGSLKGPEVFSVVLKLYNLQDRVGIFASDGALRILEFDDLCSSTEIYESSTSHKDVCFDFDGVHFNLQFNEHDQKVYFLSANRLQSFQINTKPSCLKNCVVDDKSSNGDQAILMQRLQDLSVESDTQTEKPSIDNVFSFLIHKNYILMITKNKFIALDLNSDRHSESYAEEGLEILCVRDNSVIFYTRFGTLETVTNRLFNLDIVENLISNGNIKLAAQYCDRNHIDYDIFLKGPGFNPENITQLDPSQALALFMAIKLPETKFLLEQEWIDRLDLNFNPLFVLRDKPFSVSTMDCLVLGSLSSLFCDLQLKSTTEVLKNAEFLSESLSAVANLTQDSVFSTVSTFINHLELPRHLSTLVNVFILIKRTELCFYLPDLPKVVRILLTKMSPEAICKASMLTFDLEKIEETHKICQRDYSTFLSFYNSSENVKFAVFDYLDDRKSALFYLVKHELQNNTGHAAIMQYTRKYRLFDDLLFFTYHGIFDFNFYELVADYKEPLDAFYLYKLSGNHEKCGIIARKNLFWREALELDPSKDNAVCFINLLIEKSMFVEVAKILVRYLNDYSSAIRFYLKGKSFRKALELYRTSEFTTGKCYDDIFDKMTKENAAQLIQKETQLYLTEFVTDLKDLTETYQKYKERLGCVRKRLNENVTGSQTTFSYSSMKSSKKALIKDRPGGVFENEYVLDKIGRTIRQIDQWRSKAEEILDVCKEFEIENDLLELFEPIKHGLMNDVEMMWDYKRRDVDMELPDVPKPELSSFFKD